MPDIELFITCVGLSIIFAYPANDLREIISRPDESVMSSFHQFVQRALKSPVTIEQRVNSLFIWLRRISNFVQKILNSSALNFSLNQQKHTKNLSLNFIRSHVSIMTAVTVIIISLITNIKVAIIMIAITKNDYRNNNNSSNNNNNDNDTGTNNSDNI